MLKCITVVLGRGSVPDPAGGAYDAWEGAPSARLSRRVGGPRAPKGVKTAVSFHS